MSSNFFDSFFADAQQGTNSTFYDFSLRLIANFDSFKAAWNGNENFRFILVAYINIFIILLVFAFVFLKNLNQYMGEKRKNRLAKKTPPKVQTAWSTNMANSEVKKRSYEKSPTPEF